MSAVSMAFDLQLDQLAFKTGRIGRRVDAASLGILDRAGQLALDRPGLKSPNGACRLLQAADGWMAVNLAREEDRAMIPAWLCCDTGDESWETLANLARSRPGDALLEQAVRLGLPVAKVGEVVANGLDAPMIPFGVATARRGDLRVVDISALWAGPMCGAILAEMGADVLKFESPQRPDPTRIATPEFFHRLNGAKRHQRLNFASRTGQAELRDAISHADVLISSARPRAFAGMGLAPHDVFTLNPGLVWVAITGYGWTGGGALRVAFGDDAAAAGGLVRWTSGGAPRFLGDALADPITGLSAALGALRGLEAGGGLLIDVSLAHCAAGAAAICKIRQPQ